MTRVATHEDPSLLPPRRADWRVANVRFDGERAALHVWLGRERGHDVFTSQIGDRIPEKCHHVSTFHVPFFTPGFHVAQEELAAIQGRDHLWFAGDWTHDIGCHEDAIVSAMRVCEALDPASARLAELRTPRVHPAGRPLPAGVPRAPSARLRPGGPSAFAT
jgi:predicted NAD/FAD-binding protein